MSYSCHVNVDVIALIRTGVTIGVKRLTSGKFANYVVQLSQLGMPSTITPSIIIQILFMIWLGHVGLVDSKLQSMVAANDTSWFTTSFVEWITRVSAKDKPAPLIVLELMENLLTDASIIPLMTVLTDHANKGLYRLLGLKLWKNRISDSGALAIAKYMTSIPRDMERMAELHLSHNSIGDNGARALVAAAASTYTGGPPLWLRIEWNELTPSLIMQSRTGGTSPRVVCNASTASPTGTNGRENKICTVAKCTKYAKGNAFLHVFCGRYQFTPYTSSELWNTYANKDTTKSSSSSSRAITNLAAASTPTVTVSVPSTTTSETKGNDININDNDNKSGASTVSVTTSEVPSTPIVSSPSPSSSRPLVH
jgi:hypothetical protein